MVTEPGVPLESEQGKQTGGSFRMRKLWARPVYRVLLRRRRCC